MKQGRASISGPYDQKVEPSSRAVNPGPVADIGNKQGNHATDSGTFKPRVDPMYPGRGYEAPMAGTHRHNSGSQGKH